MPEMTHCPACGSPVTVHQSQEGTGCYVPLTASTAIENAADKARIAELEQQVCDRGFTIDQQNKQIAALEKALRFYANKESYEGAVNDIIDWDKGGTARQALEKER